MARTMRIMAKLGSHEVIALINSGLTHNFINKKVAELLTYQWSQLIHFM